MAEKPWTTNYPTAIDDTTFSFTSVNTGDVLLDNHTNALAQAVINLQTKLGLPDGSTVDSAFEAISDLEANLSSHRTNDGSGGGTDTLIASDSGGWVLLTNTSYVVTLDDDLPDGFNCFIYPFIANVSSFTATNGGIIVGQPSVSATTDVLYKVFKVGAPGSSSTWIVWSIALAEHGSQHNHDGSDPISSIGDADADTYIDTNTGGTDPDRIDYYVGGARKLFMEPTYTRSEQEMRVFEGSTTTQVRVRGTSIAKTTAPNRGVVSRDNICFAWGRVTIDITGNTATLNEGHNVDTVTWVSDDYFDVVFHNTASSANHGATASSNIYGDTVTFSNFATTGFRVGTSPTAVSNYIVMFLVFTKDLT